MVLVEVVIYCTFICISCVFMFSCVIYIIFISNMIIEIYEFEVKNYLRFNLWNGTRRYMNSTKYVSDTVMKIVVNLYKTTS